MKILYIVPDFGQTSETFVEQLVFGLRGKGHTVVLAGHSIHARHADEFRFHPLPLQMPGVIDEKLIGKLPGALGDRLNAARGRSMSGKASKVLSTIMEAERPDAIYIEYFHLGLPLVATLRKFKGPVITHCHGYDVTSALNAVSSRERIPGLVDAVSRFITTSKHIRNRVRLWGVPQAKLHQVKLGVEVKGVEPDGWDLRLQNNYIMSLGRLTSKKNPLAVIEAFQLLATKYPDLRYKIVGDGELMPEVCRAVERHGLTGRIDLLGALPHVEALQLLNGARAYVQHSATGANGDQEGFGLSIAEAALLGLPVVSTYHNGIPEQVVHGESGFLVPEYDFDGIAEALDRLLNCPETSRRMGVAGQERIAGEYGKERRIDAIERLLKGDYA